MLTDLVGGLFKIIESILKAPTWLVVSVVIVLAVIYGIAKLFGFDDDDDSDSPGTGGGSGGGAHISKKEQIEFDKPEHTFVFYDSQGDRCGRGDCFYDNQGYRRSWGDGFYDGKGEYRNWGENYYDARGVFRSWGECFYDAEGNLVYPD